MATVCWDDGGTQPAFEPQKGGQHRKKSGPTPLLCRVNNGPDLLGTEGAVRLQDFRVQYLAHCRQTQKLVFPTSSVLGKLRRVSHPNSMPPMKRERVNRLKVWGGRFHQYQQSTFQLPEVLSDGTVCLQGVVSSPSPGACKPHVDASW